MTKSMQGLAGCAAAAFCFPAHAADSKSERNPSNFEEVIVTAQRREQRALDVAGALQVYSGQDLERLGADNFEDYLLDVPGLSLREQGNGSQRIAIRGVSNIAGGEYVVGDPASTVGLYLNDVALIGTAIMPDLELYDLNRVEVLKGPQGTLYGESAMGGAIKMIVNDPDLTRFEGKADASLSSTEHGGLNHAVRGMVNMPIATDKVALRVVGTYKSEDGFVDNIATGEKDHNDGDSWSIRALLRAKLTEGLTADVLALRNKLEQSEFPQVSETLDDLQINVVEPRYTDSEVSVLGLTLNYDMGPVTLTSISSYFELDRTFLDTVPFVGGVLTGFFGVPPGLYTQESFEAGSITESFAQEFRLVSQGDNRVDWVVGAFYRKKEFDADSNVPIATADFDRVNAALVANGIDPFSTRIAYERHVKDEYEHMAAYGELNIELVSRLEFTVGLRWFDETIDDVDRSVGSGPLAFYTTTPAFHGNASDGFIPKFGLKYSLSKEASIYAQAAKGFRSPLYNIQEAFGVGDEGADSDNLWNYELGAKTLWADGRLSLDVAAFYIDWKDIQITLVDFSPVFLSEIGFIENGGEAEIKGAEVALTATPFDSFRFGLNVGYTDSEMVVGERNVLSGQVLPNSPEWTAGANAEYRFVLGTLGDAFVRLGAQFVDEQATKAITTTNDGEYLDSYTMGNLLIGVESVSDWGISVFIDNLWDERAQFGRGISSPNPTINPDRFTIARPRTFGITFQKSFR